MAHLARRIADAGPLGVAAFMEEALFHPRWGYYATRDPLGARGDFITAPEISQVFGELIGLWCVDLWQRLEAALAPHRVEWRWVRGHAGHPENERADALARAGCAAARST